MLRSPATDDFAGNSLFSLVSLLCAFSLDVSR